ncbi:FAD-dependent monooxygenase [Devosia oryziradicis]|uniref:FAD-dependent monooxygenase n=1 Tax=Devosia oryziradicis TaxID=2801335 RepID=A0ABX7BZ79_9HYPH|nr:FAD-dependent monooxygenase [Devosia oryziradicis]QQR37265.1 FAD-dependent monooxygenase [Devosia oryziradicis]
MSQVKSVLIAGAGIAGPALAFWLGKLGLNATIVERAPALRTGGYAVDFRGTAIDVLNRMGLLEQVRACDTHMGDMIYVDRNDRQMAVLPAAAMSGEIEIIRGDLVGILHDATKAGTEYIFGDAIAFIENKPDGVEVIFESGIKRHFDLVVGADGLRSSLRRMAFGPEAAQVQDLGLYASIFSVPNTLGLDYSGRLFSAPGSLAGVYSARQNREARTMFFFNSPEPLGNLRDVAAQKGAIRHRYQGQGWHVPQLLKHMDNAADFYFDSVSLVSLPKWSKGRIGLLGDAACCASPLSGMGTGLAVVGAYILAHELAACGSDFVSAFANYQARMQPFATASQKLAMSARGGFVPNSSFGIAVRNLMLKVLPLMPGNVIMKPVQDAAETVTLSPDGWAEAA